MLSESFIETYQPDYFIEVLSEPLNYSSINEEHLCEFLFMAIRLYGQTNQSLLIKSLIPLYTHCLTKTEPANRMAVYELLISNISSKELSFNALLPFICQEIDRQLTSRAVIDYVHWREITHDDPLGGVNDIIQFIVGDRAENPGALLGGLALTGDARVFDLLRPQFKLLSHKNIIDEFVRVHSGFTYASVFEFYFDWLEYLNENFADDLFGALAAGIINTIRADKTGTVFKVKRHFGTSGSDLEPIELLQNLSFSEHFQLCNPRLQSLAQSEHSPGIMFDLIELWQQSIQD